MNTLLLKKYSYLFVATILFTLGFIYLEKNSHSYSIQLDQSKSLSEQSRQVIKSLIGAKAVKFEVYTQKNSAVANKIRGFFEPYKRINSKIIVEFVDPTKQPNKVKTNAVTMQGEIILSYQDLKILGKINITELSESAIINALLKLQNNKDEWLIFAEGYGMQTVDDDSDDGLSHLLIGLKKLGFHVARMPLNISLVLPENVKVIVLPAPTKVLNNEIVKWLGEQMAQGISIWWLTDIQTVPQPNLELMLDVVVGTKSLIIDDEYSGSIAQFPKNKITDNFNQPLYIAEANEIIGHEYLDLIHAKDRTIGVSKQSINNRIVERIVVTGDASFINNQYLNVAANKSFTIRTIDWLFGHDDRINIPVKININTQLYLSQTQLILLSVFFLILLPLSFIVIAWKQFRASRA